MCVAAMDRGPTSSYVFRTKYSIAYGPANMCLALYIHSVSQLTYGITKNYVSKLSHNYIFKRCCFINLIVGTHKGFKHIPAIIKALFMVGKRS
jgi:hypothetical protein